MRPGLQTLDAIIHPAPSTDHWARAQCCELSHKVLDLLAALNSQTAHLLRLAARIVQMLQTLRSLYSRQAEQSEVGCPALQTADDMDQDTAADLRTIASPRSIKASAEAGPSPIAQLIGILGEDVSQAQASRLLFEANGDVARAVNEFYEPGASPRVASDTPSSRKQATSLVPASTKRKAASTVRALPASKKAKAQSKAGQKQITTFFGAGATKVLAQQGARASGTAQLSSVMQQQAQALPQSAQGAGHPTSSCSLKPPLPVEDGAADTRPRQLYADAGGAAMIKQDPHAGADESEAHAAGQEAADSALAELASDAAGAALPTASKPGRHSISLPPVPFSGKPSASVKPSAEELHKGSGKPQQAAAAELQGVRPARSPSPSAHATPPASPARKTPSLDPGAGARLPQGKPTTSRLANQGMSHFWSALEGTFSLGGRNVIGRLLPDLSLAACNVQETSVKRDLPDFICSHEHRNAKIIRETVWLCTQAAQSQVPNSVGVKLQVSLT